MQCVKTINYTSFCYNCGLDMGCFLRENYRRLWTYITEEKFTKINSHFFPQVWHCQLAHHWEDYQFLKYGRNEEFYDELMQIFKSRDFPRSLVEQSTVALRNLSTTHATYMNQGDFKEKLCRNETLLKLLYKNYFYDFQQLGFRMKDACPLN